MSNSPKTRSIGEFALTIAQKLFDADVTWNISNNSQKNLSEVTLTDGQRRPLVEAVKQDYANSFWYECWLNSVRIWQLWNTKTPLLAARVSVSVVVCVLSLFIFTDKVGRETGCLEAFQGFDNVNVTNRSIRQMFTAKTTR